MAREHRKQCSSERLERFYEPEPNSGCWIWFGNTAEGYGYIAGRGAHRIAYELYRGPIPAGLQIDHLCRVRSCVNPAHMEPVTIRENLRRGQTIAAANAAKERCPKGHEFTFYRQRGTRYCQPCRNEWQRAKRASRVSKQFLRSED